LTIHLLIFRSSIKVKNKLFFSQNNTGEENRKGRELSTSAFIVEDKTINSMVTWLDSALEEAYGTITIPHKLLELGFDASVAGWAERLGYAMFQLNIIAVDARYGSGEAKIGAVTTSPSANQLQIQTA
jgi:hypothetical protein